MCGLNESPCILVFNVLCHIQIRLGRTYGPSGLVTYTKHFCTHVGIVTLPLSLTPYHSNSHTLYTHTYKATIKFYLLSCPYFFPFPKVRSLILLLSLLLLYTHWLRSTGTLGWFSVRCSLDTRTSPSLWSAATWSWASTRLNRPSAAIGNAGRSCTLVCQRSICAGHVSWSTTPGEKK